MTQTRGRARDELRPALSHCREPRWRLPSKPDRLGRAGRPPALLFLVSWLLGRPENWATHREASAPTRHLAEGGGRWRPGLGSVIARSRLPDGLGLGSLAPNFVPRSVRSSSGSFTQLDCPWQPLGRVQGLVRRRECHGALTHPSGRNPGPRKRPFATPAHFQDGGALGVVTRPWLSGPRRKLSPHARAPRDVGARCSPRARVVRVSGWAHLPPGSRSGPRQRCLLSLRFGSRRA